MQISENVSRKLRAVWFLGTVGTLAWFLSNAWDDMEYLFGQNFPVVDLAWVQLASALFIAAAIIALIGCLFVYTNENTVYAIPDKADRTLPPVVP